MRVNDMSKTSRALYRSRGSAVGLRRHKSGYYKKRARQWREELARQAREAREGTYREVKL